MPFIKVKLIDGAFDHAQKQQIVSRLVEAMESIDGKHPRSATWVVIEEVRLDEFDNHAKAPGRTDVNARSAALAGLTV